MKFSQDKAKNARKQNKKRRKQKTECLYDSFISAIIIKSKNRNPDQSRTGILRVKFSNVSRYNTGSCFSVHVLGCYDALVRFVFL